MMKWDLVIADICMPIQIGLLEKKSAYAALCYALKQCEEFTNDIKSLL